MMTGTFELTVAPNGARKTRADHPALPITIEELANTARSCQLAGAGAIHLHVRDDHGVHSLDAGRYRDAISAIEERAPGLEIQITTESAGLFDVETQYQCLADLRPAAASISIREMARDAQLAAKTYALTRETGTKIQHILYDATCIERFLDWRQRGIIAPSQVDVIFVLGQYIPPIPALPTDLEVFLSALSETPVNWTVCAFGPSEIAFLLWAIQHGGSARIGFENNLLAPSGDPLENNAQGVRMLADAANALGFQQAHLPRQFAA